MEYVIRISLDNAAFEENPGQEITRIIESKVLPALKEGEISEDITLRDINGNTVGYASIID